MEQWEDKMRVRMSRTSRISALLTGGALALSPMLAAQALAAAPAPAASGDNTVGEVVVTAQFRQQSLQKTPLAISAVTGAALEAKGATNVTDIAKNVPNTVIGPLGSGWGSTLAAFIRGVGLGDNILSFEPGVPIYVDGVYNGRPQGAIFDLLDLDRVEVVRGPQGTLFGKNAIGGAVSLISKKPTGTDTGYIEAGYGSYNRVNIRAAWDGVIVPDKLFIHAAFSSKNADGYMSLLDYVCVHGAGSLGNIQPAAGTKNGGSCVTDHLGSEGVNAGRLALRWIESDKFEVNLIGDYTRQRQEAPTDKYTYIADPKAFPGPFGIDGVLPQFWVNTPQQKYGAGVLYDQRFVTTSPYTSYASYGVNPVDGRFVPNENNLDHWGISGTTDAELAPMVHLKTITAYRKWWNTFGRGDASPLGNSATFDDTRHNQFTEEVQLTGTVSRLDYALGGFYYHAYDRNTGFDSLWPTPPGLPPLPPGSFQGPLPFLNGLGLYDHDLDDHQTTDDYAFFAHGIYHVTDALLLTAGVRYTNDSKHAVVGVTNRYTNVGDFSVPVDVHASRWNPMVELSYQFTPDVMAYALYSTGFRGGGFSPRPANALQPVPFGPEDVTSYEAGVKSEWFEHRLRLNADLFWMEDKGQQNFKTDVDSSGATWFHELNAGNSTNKGFEIELAARPIEGLQIDSSLGYLHYELHNDIQSQTTLICTHFSDGSLCPQTRAPKWTFSFGAQYRFEMGKYGSITPRMDAQVISRVYFIPITASCSSNPGPGNPCPPGDIVNPNKQILVSTDASGVAGGLNYQPGYTLLNGRITWIAPDNKWSVALSVSNLTDKVYFYGKLALAVNSLGREQGNIAPPRQWLVTVRKDF
jgi:iron complex outermembrane receptor protein